ncbi:MAG: amidohydrolase family protein [Pseudomonadales bacterium]|nr:amidohydrolase family protein [Pseudomonadales bacterium]MBO6704190.1 amidohydrolase family protein [Pseudomonadales bacterium]MBO7006003.1 amidohydrolase family protein [Pseudomonadales bacterium]
MTEEAIIDPDRPIIDPHHHLWQGSRLGGKYLVEDLHADTESGHNIVKTVFVECGASYREEGPEHLRPLGETEFVIQQAKRSERKDGAVIAGIVGRADLGLGDGVREVLEAHLELGEGRFRGIRHAGARDPHPEALMIAGRAPEGLYADGEYRTGMKVLGEMGLTFDTWHYHHQNPAFAELARACPNTQMILDHFGTPLGVGPYADKREEIFEQWKKDIAEIAKCDNVVAKIGGMAMPDNGFGWHDQDEAVSSDEFVEAQKRYYLHTIECFGADRCLMESNFPVDKMSISYPVLYNGLKKIVAEFSEDEKHAMFYGNAERVYRLA